MAQNNDPAFCCDPITCQQKNGGACADPRLCHVDPGECGLGSMYANPGTNTACNYSPTIPTPAGNWYQNLACAAGGVAATASTTPAKKTTVPNR